MLRWVPIVLLVLLANFLFAFAMNGAARAFQDWGAAYARRRTRRVASSSGSQS
jgi:hypothetical protein